MLNPVRFVRNAFSRNPDRRLGALSMMAHQMFGGDFRLTWSQIDWWHDPAFNAYLDRFSERGVINHNTHRRWMVKQLTKLVKDVPGDTAECGVWRGSSSWIICNELRRPHHIFDSFEGLSAPLPLDGTHWKKGALAAPEEVVERNLEGFDIHLYKGWIPDRFDEVKDKKFAFVHVDVDLYEPTKASIEFFYPHLSPGGILLCDDYGCSTCPGATKAFDEYGAPEPIIALDAGGGFLIKR